jgi:hypothetical protein
MIAAYSSYFGNVSHPWVNHTHTVKHRANGTMNFNICGSGLMRPRKWKEGEGSYAYPLRVGGKLGARSFFFLGGISMDIRCPSNTLRALHVK